MLDYSALLYDPVYAEIGVPCLFVSGALEVDLTVIDDTRAKALPAGTSAEVRSVGPGAFVRIPELTANGITRDNWLDALLSFNGLAWSVRSWELRGSPNGEDAGEVRFLLKAAPVSSPSPDWVPANAKIHIDFLGNRAWNGAIVAIDTLLGNDPNTEIGWTTSVYDPTNLTADGYVTDGHTVPAFIGAALSKVIDAATIVVKTKKVSNSQPGFSPFVVMSADGNDAVEVNADGDSLYGRSYSGPLALLITGRVNIAVGSQNCVAMTLTSNRLDAAVDGSAAVANMLADADRPAANPLIAALIDPNVDHAIQSITIYDPLPDTAGLSELSQVGGGGGSSSVSAASISSHSISGGAVS